MKYIKFLPLSLFIVYCFKLLFLGASFPDAIVMGIVGILSGVCVYFENSREIKELNDKLQKQDDLFNEKIKDLENVKSAVSALRLTTGVKNVDFRQSQHRF